MKQIVYRHGDGCGDSGEKLEIELQLASEG